MDSLTIFVDAEWDAEAGVFVATSNQVPGLIAEAETLGWLEQKLVTLVPELLDLNGPATPGQNYDDRIEVPLIMRSVRRSKVRVHV